MQERIFEKVYMILIGTQTCIKTGMSLRCNFDESFNNNIIRQHRIQTKQKSRIQHIDIKRNICMRKKLPGVYSGIGSAASKGFNFLSANG